MYIKLELAGLILNSPKNVHVILFLPVTATNTCHVNVNMYMYMHVYIHVNLYCIRNI